MLGVFLLNDKDGRIVERIKQDKKVTNKIVFEMFRRWLQGEGHNQKNGNTRPNRTWERLVYYLRLIKDITLAEDIESVLQACIEEKHKCSQREKEQIYSIPQDNEFETSRFNLYSIIASVLVGIIGGIMFCYCSGKNTE